VTRIAVPGLVAEADRGAEEEGGHCRQLIILQTVDNTGDS